MGCWSLASLADSDSAASWSGYKAVTLMKQNYTNINR
ncbi:unnamed protein product, partial [marine sediment metagenome]